MLKSSLLFICVGLLSFSASASMPDYNLTAVGQGVAMPNTTSLINIGRGYIAAENPAGLMYIDGFHVAIETNKDTVTATGYEASYSGKNYGAGVGIFNTGCEGCLDQTSAVLGASFKYVNVGLRYQKINITPTYGLGLLFNATGKHRFGIHVEDDNPEVSASSIVKTGVGYAYVSNEDMIDLEMTQSKASTTPAVSRNSIGYKRKVSNLEVSMTYEMSSDGTDAFWMGAGFKGSTFQLSIYSQYYSKMLVVLSAFF